MMKVKINEHNDKTAKLTHSIRCAEMR